MSYSQGIDFRATAGYVTDPPGCDAEISALANYPRLTAQGNIVGWEQAPSSLADRSAAIDARLAGIAFNSSLTSEVTYRLDVPNGLYTVTLALGDATTVRTTTARIYDGATLRATATGSTLGGQFIDASGAIRTSPTDWAVNEVPVTVQVASGILRVAILRGTIAHLRAETAPVAPGPVALVRARPRPQRVRLPDLTVYPPNTATPVVTALRVMLAPARRPRLRFQALRDRIIYPQNTATPVVTTLTRLIVRGRRPRIRVVSLRDRAVYPAPPGPVAPARLPATLVQTRPRRKLRTALHDPTVYPQNTAPPVETVILLHHVKLPDPHLTGPSLSQLSAPAVILSLPAGNVCTADFHAFVTDMEASTDFTDWCSAQPGECAIWTTYSRTILAGGTPPPPAMSTSFGDALVDAGIIALDGIARCHAARAPHAAFSFAVGGLTVAFTNLSTPGASGGLVSWAWDFGDGANDTTSWSPSHTYAGAGTYIVSLTVVGAGDDGISSVVHAVTVFVPGTSGFHIDAVAL